MKLKYSFEKMTIDENVIAVPLGAKEFKSVIELNETASRIFDILKDDVTEDDIVEILINEYDIEKEKLVKYIHEFVTNLKEEKLVE